jgi:hypothetical protein
MNSRAQKVLTVIDAALHTAAQRVRAAVSSSPRRARKAANGPDNISAVIRAGNRFFSELTGEEISGQNLDEFIARLFNFWDAASEPHTGFSLCALTERHLKTGPLKNFSDCLPPLLAFFTSETAKLREGKSPTPAHPAPTAPAASPAPAPVQPRPQPAPKVELPLPQTETIPAAADLVDFPLTVTLQSFRNEAQRHAFFRANQVALKWEAYEQNKREEKRRAEETRRRAIVGGSKASKR